MSNIQKTTGKMDELDKLIHLIEEKILRENRWDTWHAGGWELHATSSDARDQ